ncbi:MAG: lauroyl acyltransferase [Candidatus Competibacteraceae bacterium]
MAQLFLGHGLRAVAAKSRLLQYSLWSLEAGILGAFWGFCSLLPPDRAVAFGQWSLSRLGPRLAKHRQVKNNLSLAFPDKTTAQIEALARAVWGNLGAVLAEYPHLPKIVNDSTGQWLELNLQTDLQPYREGKKAAVFVAAHLGNWELGAAVAVRMDVPLTALYAPLTNPLLNRMLWRKRQLLKCNFLAKEDSMRATVRLLSKGTSMGFLVDQRIDSGDMIPFFGMAAPTTSSPARLALKLGCDLIPLRVERLQGAHFRINFYPPIKPDDEQADNTTKALQMTRKVNASFEEWIRQRPEQWLCTKRRWPKTVTPINDGH